MANQQGDFLWYELITTDPDAASAFYGEILGWGTKPSDQPDMDYREFQVGQTSVAGMLAMPANSGDMRPGWLGYIAVDDVDAALVQITAAGGTVHMPAMDIPNVGRFAMVGDPQGAVFYVMTGVAGMDNASFSTTAVGHCNWNELAASDQVAALDFYSEQFGWVAGDSMDMGPVGKYQFITQQGVVIGAMMNKPPEAPMPGWTYYFRVDDIDAATAKTRALGGTLMHGPVEVPGGDSIIIAADPQGAVFALVGARGN